MNMPNSYRQGRFKGKWKNQRRCNYCNKLFTTENKLRIFCKKCRIKYKMKELF